MLWRSVFCPVWGRWISFPILQAAFFVLLIMSFGLQKLLLQEISFIIFLSVCNAWAYDLNVVLFTNVFKCTSNILFYVVQCVCLHVVVLIHWDLNFVHDDRCGSTFILPHIDIQLCQHHLLNIFSILYFLVLCRKSGVVGKWIDIWVLESVPLVLLSIFVPIPGSLQYCSSVFIWRIQGMWSLQKLFLYRIVLAIMQFFWLFYMKLSVFILRSLKNFSDIYMGMVFCL